MDKREKQLSLGWKRFLLAVGKLMILILVVYGIALLSISFFIYKDLLQMGNECIALGIIWAIVAVISTATASYAIKEKVLATVLAAEAFLFLLFLLGGPILSGTMMKWSSFFVSVLSCLLVTLFSALLFVGRKRKKFQKNTPSRLKKK